MRRYTNLLVNGWLLALFLMACGGAGSTTTAATDNPLVIYSGRSEELVAPLIASFESDTGIDVEVRYGSSTEMAGTINVEGALSPADVFYAQDPATIGAVANLLAPIPEEVLTLVPERFRDPDGYWTGITVRSRVLAYNPELVSPGDLPDSFHALTDPAWAGRIGIAPTNGSFLTFVAAMIVLEGEEDTLQWLTGLAENDPVEFDGNAPIAAAVDAGDISVGLINHYYLLRLGAEQGGTTAANHFFPNADAGSFVMPAGAAILATAHNPEGAATFLEYLLSSGSQTYFAESVFEYPVVAGAPAPAGAPPLDSLVTPQVSLADLAAAFDRATDLISESGLL